MLKISLTNSSPHENLHALMLTLRSPKSIETSRVFEGSWEISWRPKMVFAIFNKKGFFHGWSYFLIYCVNRSITTLVLDTQDRVQGTGAERHPQGHHVDQGQDPDHHHHIIQDQGTLSSGLKGVLLIAPSTMLTL